MKCNICKQPIRTPQNQPKIKAYYNKLILTVGQVCWNCAVKARQAKEEADKLTWEERAQINLKRMKERGMSDKEIEEAIKVVDENETKISH